MRTNNLGDDRHNGKKHRTNKQTNKQMNRRGRPFCRATFETLQTIYFIIILILRPLSGSFLSQKWIWFDMNGKNSMKVDPARAPAWFLKRSNCRDVKDERTTRIKAYIDGAESQSQHVLGRNESFFLQSFPSLYELICSFVDGVFSIFVRTVWDVQRPMALGS